MVFSEREVKRDTKGGLTKEQEQKRKNSQTYRLHFEVYHVPTLQLVSETDLYLLGNFTCGASFQNNLMAVVLQDRTVIIYDLQNHTHQLYKELKGCGVIQSCCFYEGEFVCYSRSGELARIGKD